VGGEELGDDEAEDMSLLSLSIDRLLSGEGERRKYEIGAVGTAGGEGNGVALAFVFAFPLG